jgi:Zn-dependent protease
VIDLGLVIRLIAAALIILISFPVHEFSHAYAAYRLGDSTARWQGRLSLDPRRHFDPFGGLMLVISSIVGFGIGWAKPTPVNPYNLAYGRRGEALVALAGPLSNLVIAAVLAIPLRLIAHDEAVMGAIANTSIWAIVWDIVFFFFFINCALFIFNLLPIPPLDGWKVLLGLVDARTAYSLRQFEQYGFIVLVILILVGGQFVSAPILFVANFLSGGAPFL